jgi:hypothetical protein
MAEQSYDRCLIIQTIINMRRTETKLLPIITAIILVSCGPGFQVTSDYDKAVDFSVYKTFALFHGKGGTPISPLNQNRITNAIRAEMEKKGFREDSTAPDLWVNTVAVLKDQVDVSSTTNYYGYGGYYRPYGWGGGMNTATTNYDVQHYKDGTLMIDVVDAKTKQLVWQGTGNKKIDKPISDADTKIPEAVAKIMEGFPPGKAKK